MKVEKWDSNGLVIEYTGGLIDNKNEALVHVSLWFDEQFKTGKFTCSLGFMVDNRRYGDKNDRDNVSGLIRLGVTTFRDANGSFHNLNMEQLIQLESEMIADGLYKYQAKWTHEAMIMNCTTIEAVWIYVEQNFI